VGIYQVAAWYQSGLLLSTMPHFRAKLSLPPFGVFD
jgi:hypothetical protein